MVRWPGMQRQGQPLPRKEDLLEEIDKAETLLFRLQADHAQVRTRLAALRAELAAQGWPEPGIRVHLPVAEPQPVPRSPEEKVRLFRQLFRGRGDVFPTRFVSKKTGKPGYAPACANKFVKRRVRASEGQVRRVPEPGFRPFRRRRRHRAPAGPTRDGRLPAARGRDLLVPRRRLRQEHLDGGRAAHSSRPAGASAFRRRWSDRARETGRTSGSSSPRRSPRASRGRWAAISSPRRCRGVTSSAWTPTTGCSRARTRCRRGGFGNLIALPLQHGPRQQGNSVFLDDQLQPLRGRPAVGVPRRRCRASTAEPSRGSPGRRRARVRSSAFGWRRRPTKRTLNHGRGLPLGSRRLVRITEPLPERVRAVLAQRLFVEKAGFPSPLLEPDQAARRLPEPRLLQEAEHAALDGDLTPRVISCAEDLPQHVALPRGAVPSWRRCCASTESLSTSKTRRVERRTGCVPLPGQADARPAPGRRTLLAHEIGVFVAPPGVGKTVVGTYLVAERGCSTLILVHRRPLLDQWRAQLSLFLGIEPEGVGQIGGGKHTRERTPRRGDDPEPRSRGQGHRSRRGLWAGHRGRVPPRAGRLVRAGSRRGQGPLRRRPDGDAASDGTATIPSPRCSSARSASQSTPKSEAAQRPFEHRLIVRDTDFKAPAVRDVRASRISTPRWQRTRSATS